MANAIHIVSSDFHGHAVLSHHRDPIVAENKLATERAVHGRECSCSGPFAVTLSRKFDKGYRLHESELSEYAR